MTYTSKRVTDRFFNRLKRHYGEEELVELAAIIALENFRSKFNPVFAVESQGFCPLPAVKEVAAEAASHFHKSVEQDDGFGDAGGVDDSARDRDCCICPSGAIEPCCSGSHKSNYPHPNVQESVDNLVYFSARTKGFLPPSRSNRSSS